MKYSEVNSYHFQLFKFEKKPSLILVSQQAQTDSCEPV